jgi:hypothetical protein
MTIIASSLSKICRNLADQAAMLLTSIDDDDDGSADNDVVVMLGNPINAIPSSSSRHQLNFFFYRFSPFEFDADCLPGESGFLRCHCLITPFGVEDNSVGSGEYDLRLLGEVIRIFHEQPIFSVTVDSQDYHVQVIMEPMAIEQISQLWGTQGDVVYRPSVAYEMSLAPILPRETAIPSPMVGSLGFDIASTIQNRNDSVSETGSVDAFAPSVPIIRVDSRVENWQPRICFVVDGQCYESLSLALGSDELANIEVLVWIAGKVGSQVQLRWDIWSPTDGWQTQAPLEDEPIIVHDTIDPNQVESTMAISLAFDAQVGQAVLYGVRSYQRGYDGVTVSVLSNPMLISIYDGNVL